MRLLLFLYEGISSAVLEAIPVQRFFLFYTLLRGIVLWELWGILGQDMLELLICGEVALEFFWELLGGDLIVGYAYGGGEALESITGKNGVFLLADEKANGGLLNGGVKEIIDHIDVSSDLSYIGEIEPGGFDFDYTIAMERYDVEEEVYELFNSS